MSPSSDHAPDLLCEELLAEAARQSAVILASAQAEATTLFTAAVTAAAEFRQQRIAASQAEATQRCEAILATVALETHRLRATRVEECLAGIRTTIQQRIQATSYDPRAVIIALAAHAARRMTGSALVLKLSPAGWAALTKDDVTEIGRRAGREATVFTLAVDATMVDGGVLLEDSEGRQTWDNRLCARLERLWPALRTQVAVQTRLLYDGPATGDAR
jgi:vacuolar-type H+-ATPase subunit E/Vma4